MLQGNCWIDARCQARRGNGRQGCHRHKNERDHHDGRDQLSPKAVDEGLQVRKTIIAGLPTGVYCPVTTSLFADPWESSRSARPSSSLSSCAARMRNVVRASLLWLHETRKWPVGSIVKLRG